MTHFVKRYWQKRWTQRITYSVFTTLTLCALLYSYLDWSWKRQWMSTVQKYEAAGESLSIDPSALHPEPVPDGENFFAIPLLQDLALCIDNDPSKGEPAAKRARFNSMEIPDVTQGKRRPDTADLELNRPLNLQSWAAWLKPDSQNSVEGDAAKSAHDILAALEPSRDLYEELAAGLERPRAEWTPGWNKRQLPKLFYETSIPHSMLSRDVCGALALRSQAAAWAGDSRMSSDSALIISRFIEADLNEQILVSVHIAVYNTKKLCGSIWELCRSGSGTAEDFGRIESSLSTLEFRTTTLQALRFETAVMAASIRYLSQDRQAAKDFLFWENESKLKNRCGKLWLTIAPASYFDSSTAVATEVTMEHFINPLKTHDWGEVVKSAQTYTHTLENATKGPLTHTMIEIFLSSYSRTLYKTAYAQAQLNQAVIACALERQRIRSGTYPETLDQLSLANGKPLPGDPMNDEKPMSYVRTPDGKYILWSVGFDGKDDGGSCFASTSRFEPVLGSKSKDDGGSRFVSERPEHSNPYDVGYRGDWVWDLSK